MVLKRQESLPPQHLGQLEASGTYIVESGEWFTPQSGVDTNQNGDAAADRVIFNPNGTPGVSSDVTALKNSAGATVAYLANNANAQYIRAQVGALATTGRNILPTPRIDNVVFGISKTVRVKERYSMQLRADMYNALNHPQYTLGNINSVVPRNTATSQNSYIPGNPSFMNWTQDFSSNPRALIVSAKFSF